MSKKKNILRISTFITILMFLLIPLLSSPVAAATFEFDVSTAFTDNTPTGPTVWWNGANPPFTTYWNSDATPRTVDFSCTFEFEDSSGNSQKPSSRHYGEIESFKRPNGPRVSDSTGVIYLNNGDTSTITLTISDTYTVQELTVYWDIMVYVECYDIPSETRDAATYRWVYAIA